MQTTIEKGKHDHEHAQYSTHTHGQPAPQPEDPFVGPAARFRKRLNDIAFVEHTKTLIVSAHGGLLRLQESVLQGQSLNLRNVVTGEEVACKVVDLNLGASRLAEIAVEFAEPNPRFWRVSFPPTDWSARSPEAKRLASSPSAAPPAAKEPVMKK